MACESINPIFKAANGLGSRCLSLAVPCSNALGRIGDILQDRRAMPKRSRNKKKLKKEKLKKKQKTKKNKKPTKHEKTKTTATLKKPQ